jgi:hypothetical protein
VCCGCSFDSSPLRAPDLATTRTNAGNVDGSGGAVALPASSGSGGNGTTIGIDTQPPRLGASAPDGGANASDAGPSTSMNTDAATSGTRNTQEPRGSYPSCSSDSDCSQGQNCYIGNPSGGPGHCAQQCTVDADCTDYDGFDFACYTVTGTCRIDCGASGSNGMCPGELRCVLDLTNNYRCRLPATSAGTGGSAAPCPFCIR